MGRGISVLVVEDDEDTRRYVSLVLERAGYQVTAVATPASALAALEEREWQILLADIGLPGMSGFELIAQAKRRHPSLGTALMTADARVDVAVQALRTEVDDFLPKPVSAGDLVRAVNRLVVRRQSRSRVDVERVLAVGAHPDDVEIGVGGILLRHRAADDEVAVLTLTCGARGGERERRTAEAASAAALMGVTLHLRDLEDTRVPVSDPTVGLIEEVVDDFHPTIVYTHTAKDLHQDHRAVHQATLVAARRVASVYCYQSPSSTVEFHPARFVGVDPYVDRKLEVLRAYASQVDLRPYLAEDLVRATARYWGRFGTSAFCEPLEVIRDRPGGQMAVAVVEGTQPLAQGSASVG